MDDSKSEHINSAPRLKSNKMLHKDYSGFDKNLDSVEEENSNINSDYSLSNHRLQKYMNKKTLLKINHTYSYSNVGQINLF